MIAYLGERWTGNETCALETCLGNGQRSQNQNNYTYCYRTTTQHVPCQKRRITALQRLLLAYYLASISDIFPIMRKTVTPRYQYYQLVCRVEKTLAFTSTLKQNLKDLLNFGLTSSSI